jgi:hypothetical protein
VVEEGLEEYVKFYNQWLEEVKQTVPKDRLLIFNVKQGWKPLCEFLEVPIPENPFPHENEKKVFRKMLWRVDAVGKIIVWLLPAMAVVSIAYTFRDSLFHYLPVS